MNYLFIVKIIKKYLENGFDKEKKLINFYMD